MNNMELITYYKKKSSWKAMKGHNIECIAYNSPERINFMKDFFLKCNKKEKIRVYIDIFAAPQAPRIFFPLSTK